VSKRGWSGKDSIGWKDGDCPPDCDVNIEGLGVGAFVVGIERVVLRIGLRSLRRRVRWGAYWLPSP
jgi:hypothetical protein